MKTTAIDDRLQDFNLIQLDKAIQRRDAIGVEVFWFLIEKGEERKEPVTDGDTK
jgi:hypothetical protein